MNKEKWIFAVLIFIAITHLLSILFYKQSIFFSRYDHAYWKDRYEHSQYVLPLSRRAIGDEGLYAYAGYRVLQADDPFSINVDKPPVGKYIFAASIGLFNNPAISSLLFGIGSCLLLYIFIKKLFNSNTYALLVTAAIALDPLFFSNWWQTTLDSSHVFFLTATLVAFQYGLSTKNSTTKYILVSLSGLCLGLFTEIKPPVLTPIIMLCMLLPLIKNKDFKSLLVGIFSFGIGMVLPYIYSVGNLINPLEIVKLHRYMASIYLDSKLDTNEGAILQTLFLGKFPHITSGELISISEWWIGLSIVAVISLFGMTRVIKKGKISMLSFITIFTLLTIVAYSFTPSYPRYIVIFLPFLYILSALFIKEVLSQQKALIALTIFLCVSFLNAQWYLLPKPSDTLSTFYYSLEHKFFQDIYHETLSEKQQSELSVSREQFRTIGQQAYDDATIQTVQITEQKRSVPLFGSKGSVTLLVTYFTRDLGTFTETKTIAMSKEQGVWKIVWDWDTIVDDYLPGYTFTKTYDRAKRGSIINSKGIPISYDQTGYLISVLPEKIDTSTEEELLTRIAAVTFLKPVAVHNAYLENPLPHTYIPVATTVVASTDPRIALLTKFSGVQLDAYQVRMYTEKPSVPEIANTLFEECCTHIYSRYSYHGKEGFEKMYDDTLSAQDGGTITLIAGDGTVVRQIVSVEKKDGTNTRLQ